MTKTPEQRFVELYEEMGQLAETEGWGEVFSYARSRELRIAFALGHTLHDEFSGADGIDQNGNPCEYKSTTGPKVQGAYSGISVQPSWAEQVEYLKNDKLAKYPFHFFARFKGAKLQEIWKVSGEDVYKTLLPKLENQYHQRKHKTTKDPRLSATLTTKEIKMLGEQVL